MSIDQPRQNFDPALPFATAEVPSDDVLAQLLGPSFLAYVSNVTEEQVVARIEGRSTLPGKRQEEAFREAIHLAGLLAAHRRPMTLNNEPALEPITEAFARFGDYFADSGMGVANALRSQAGGAVYEVQGDDPVKAALGRIARDWFPVTLIPESSDGPFGGTPFRFRLGAFSWQHPGLGAFADAISRGTNDPLRRLFPEGEVDAMTSSRPVMSNSGQGGALQVGTLASTLTSNAEMRIRLRGKLTLDTYLREIEAQVDELRALFAGDTVIVPAAVGLGPAQVAENFRIVTPWGVVVPASTWHRQQAPVQADLVLLTEFGLRLDLDFEFGENYKGPSREFLEAHTELERRIDLVRLTFTLGLDREPPIAVTPTWRLIADPTRISGFSWQPAPLLPSATQICECDQAELERWGKVIDRHFHPSLGLAVRRTLGSIAMRHDPADGLVDAVIALENMFGTGKSEVGFRLSAALAWLLESDAKARLARQKAVTKLYELRSQIVHGGEVDARKLYSERTAASSLAVDALRTLFVDWPNLIPAGDQRGKLLVLQSAGDVADPPVA